MITQQTCSFTVVLCSHIRRVCIMSTFKEHITKPNHDDAAYLLTFTFYLLLPITQLHIYNEHYYWYSLLQ